MKSYFTIVCILILFLVSTFSDSFAQTDWMKYQGNPVLVPGSAGTWNDFSLAPGSILFDGTTYHIWYGGHDGTFVRIGYATSVDGISWTSYEQNPVLDVGAAGSWEDEWVYKPYVLFDGSTYHMWYTGYDGTRVRIGYATSTDRTNWTKYENNPVMDTGPENIWEGNVVESPCILFDGNTYHMWYNGQDETSRRIGYATSPDGISWTKYEGNPVLDIGATGTWDQSMVEAPDVIFDGTKYHMWYSGVVGGWSWRIGYATSLDGISWEKYAGNPVLDLGTTGSWDDQWVGYCRVLFDTTTSFYKMWYGGSDADWNGHFGYAVDFSSVAHSDSLSLNATYRSPGSDNLQIEARIVNPEENTLTVKAQIVSDDSTIVDSTELSDQEGGIWGGSWLVPAGEFNYRVGIKTIDETSGMIHDGIKWNVERFTTVGPIIVEDYEITSSDTVPEPGDNIRVNLTLKNEGQTASALNITTPKNLISLDSNTTISSAILPNYGDLAPGETSAGSRSYIITFSEESEPGKDYFFVVDILSDDFYFWSDTFSVELVLGIEDVDEFLPVAFALRQNYPNPFNPTTIINYELPITNDVELSIYDLLGQKVATLVSEKQNAGYHQIEWDASHFSSGVYFYTIQAGNEFAETKKMLLIR